MNLEDDTNGEFSIPTEMVDKLYELSGGADKYKGVILAVSSENGKPLIYCKFDCGMTEFALTKALENHLGGPSEPMEEGK
jgi:hypothetical protein|tara:strand:+ start:608 stop:847 length:240 start_codon:yes stop_codon:yes gene_type:complete